MIKEAIILAGGFGTRLRSVVSDQPKCMAPVNGKPFLSYLINFLQAGGIEKFIFSVGYLHESIEHYLQENYSSLDYEISLESEPLGTGGAIKLACEKSTEENVVACNGDTLFEIDLKQLSIFHATKNATCSLSLKPMENFDRYGVVELNESGSIRSFKEKKFYASGLINGGVYALNVESFRNENFPEKFSFEKDYLEKNISASVELEKLFGIIQDKYFIDIGIPEDYERAQIELKIKNFSMTDLNKIDKTWTLFLDRDGVINDEKHLDYIHTWDEFRFYDGVKEAIKIFTGKFGKLFIVTNQRGIAKGVTKAKDLDLIHKNMLQEISDAGGRVDKLYFCADMESPNRKPNPGMGLQAQRDFPEVDFSKSIMIGNTLSDMKFGRNLGVAANIFLPTTRKDVDLKHEDIDLVFADLIAAARAL